MRGLILLGMLLSLWATAEAQRTDLPQQDLGLAIATHYGAGDCSAATLNAAITAIGSTVTTLLIPPVPRNSVTPCTWNLSTAVTVPGTLTLYIPRGVILTPAAGVTLSIAGSLLAPESRIFNADESTTGLVRFTSGTIHTIPAAWFGMVCDNTTQSGLALRAAINSTPVIEATQVEGAIVRLPAGRCAVATALVPTKPIYLQGAGGGRQNSGDHANTSLNYTGTGTFITLTGNATSGSVLEGFNIDHNPTGSAASVAIDITSGSTATVLRDLSILSPTTLFTIAGIRLGNTASIHSTTLQNVFVRRSAPIGLLCEAVQSGLYIHDSTIHHHNTMNMQLGRPAGGGDECKEVQITNSRFENQDEGGDGIRIYRAEFVHIRGAHFEIQDPTTTARAAIRIDEDAEENHQLVIENSRFNVQGHSTAQAIHVNSPSQIMTITNSTFENANTIGAPGYIFNFSSRFIALSNNYRAHSAPPGLVSRTGGSTLENVDERNTLSQGGPREYGRFPDILCQDYSLVPSIGAGASTLATCTLPGGTLPNNSGLYGFTVHAFGQFANDGDTKRVRLYIDNVAAVDTGALAGTGTGSDDIWDIRCNFGRTQSSTLQYSCLLIIDDDQSATETLRTTLFGQSITIATSLENDITIRVQADGTNDDDVLLRGFTLDTRRGY